MLTITHHRALGAYEISAIIGGYLIHKVYLDHTRREAIAAFRADTAGLA